MIRVMLVDDHKIFRQGIAGLLRSEKGFEVVAEAGNGKDALRLAIQLKPDIIILDVSLPDTNGIEVARRLKQEGVDAFIILLTMHKDEDLLDMASDTGIRGYLLKEDAIDDLVYAIKAVARGEGFISASINGDSPDALNYPTRPSPLTGREKEIATLVAEGFTNKEIADRLFISVKTVETHRARIMEKLELKGVADLVRYAIKSGLVQP